MRLPHIMLGLLFGGLAAGGLRSPWAWTLVCAGIWIAVYFARWLSPVTLKPWLPWMAWASIAALASSQPLKSLYPLSRWFGLIAFFCLIRSLWGERERKAWFWSFCFAGFILALAGLVTGARELMLEGFSNAMTGLLPPYYNYTVFAVAGVAAAVFAALLHRAGPEGKQRWILWGLLAFLLLWLLAARGRAGLLAVIAAASYSAWRQGRARKLLVIVMVLVLGGGALTLAAMKAHGMPWTYILKLDKAQAFKRPQLWRSAMEVAADHPWLGEGPGNFESGFLRHNFPSHYGLANYQFTTDYAHSEPLQLAAETGWAGLCLFIFALVVSTNFIKPNRGQYAHEAALGAAAAMSAQMLVDNMLQMPALAMLYLSAIACAQAQSAPDSAPTDPGLENIFRKAAAAAGLAVCLIAWIPQWGVHFYGRQAAESDPAARVQPAQRAVKIFPADSGLREDLARAWLGLSPPRPDLAEQELIIASRLNPTNALYPAMRAQLLRQFGSDRDPGRWPKLLSLAETALRLEPNFLQARLLRAEALSRLRRKEQARLELDETLRRHIELGKGGLYFGHLRGFTGYEITVGDFNPQYFAFVRKISL